MKSVIMMVVPSLLIIAVGLLNTRVQTIRYRRHMRQMNLDALDKIDKSRRDALVIVERIRKTWTQT
jgi:hypothetical protein